MKGVEYIAETLDRLRVFPRAFLGIYVFLCFEVFNWIFQVPAGELGNNHAIIGGAIAAGYAGILKFYVDTGANAKNGG